MTRLLLAAAFLSLLWSNAGASLTVAGSHCAPWRPTLRAMMTRGWVPVESIPAGGRRQVTLVSPTLAIIEVQVSNRGIGCVEPRDAPTAGN